MSRIALALLLAAAGGAQAAEPRPFDVRDLVMLDRVSDPRLAPDGRHVAFQVRETDLEANKGVNGIWLRALDGGTAARRLTTRGYSSTAPRWAPDGAGIYFLSTRSGSQQVWRLELAGGEARQVTDYPLDVGAFAVSPDGRRLALSMEVFPDCADLACSKQRFDRLAAAMPSGTLHDKLFVRHWDTWKNGSRSQLFVATLGEGFVAAGDPLHLSRGIDGDVPGKPFGDDGEWAFAPDGRTLVFGARIAGRTEAWSTNHDLFEVPVDGSAPPRNLTAANAAVDTGPVFSPDGRTLYWRAMKRPGFEADRFAVMAMDRRSGAVREIAADWDRSAGALAVSPRGDTLYVLADDLGEQKLFAIGRRGAPEVVADGGNVSGFAVGRDGVVFVRDDLAGPAQLFRTGQRGGEARRLTDFNAQRLAGVSMGAFEQFRFPGWNDETVHGFVVKPWNHRPGTKAPVAFIIHGGPQGSMGNAWHYRWNPQTYAGQGYAVVFIDFHGSTGYGQAFTDSISGDWGGKPLVDLQKGLAHALANYDFLDASRVCALGASYGGYMINWIAGNWREPFRCLVNHSGIFDNRSMGYATEELWFDEWEMQGTPFDAPENYERHNPVNHVASWTLPMLVIHGALDFRVPLEQGIATFTALQRRGIESRFLHFPDENHWILKPQNSILWHDTVEDWLARHLTP